jgi:transcriptional regulator GlxA family with amidase domain
MSEPPVDIAILVFPENSASVVYGLYDLFLSAGRDWGVITEGRPGPELIRPRLVARYGEPFEVSNGIRITPDATLRDCPPVDIICVPEVNLPPGEALAERYSA